MKRPLLWIMETRPQFLTLSIVLTFLGTAIAWYHGPVNLWYAVLAGVGLMLTHGSVNAINDYFDYKSGIDLDTRRTPFSGGSGLVPEGRLPLNQALWVGVITSFAAIGANGINHSHALSSIPADPVAVAGHHACQQRKPAVRNTLYIGSGTFKYPDHILETSLPVVKKNPKCRGRTHKLGVFNFLGHVLGFP